MRINPFTKYRLRAWFWLFSAYWRMWPILLRLRWSGFTWLHGQVEFQQAIILDSKATLLHDNFLLAMHEIVRLAARLHFLQADCLPKSIVLMKLLKRQGYQARTVVGVNKTASQLASHAWVEVLFDEQWAMVGEPESVAREFTRV